MPNNNNIHAVIKLCSFLGICPGLNAKTDKFNGTKALYVALPLLLINSAAGMYLVYAGDWFSVLIDAFLVFVNGYAIRGSQAGSLGSVQGLYDKIVEVDAVLFQANFETIETARNLISALAAINFGNFIITLFGFCVKWHGDYGLAFFYVNFVYYIQYAIFSGHAAAEYFFLTAIGQRSAGLNKLLRKFNCAHMVDAPGDGFRYSLHLEKSELLVFLNSSICDLVDLFNQLFGAHFFMCVVFCMSRSIGMIHEIYMKSGDLAAGEVIFTLLIIIYAWIMCFSWVNASETIASERKIFMKMLFKATNTYADNIPVRKNLKFIAVEATLRPVCITANDFFALNYSMLFMLTNIMVTYIIASVQFTK